MSAYRNAELPSQPKFSFVDRLMLSGSLPSKILGSFLFFFVFIGMVIKNNRKYILIVIGSVGLAMINVGFFRHYKWFTKGLDEYDQWFYSCLAGSFFSLFEGILFNGIYLCYKRSQQLHLEKLRTRLTSRE